MKKRYWDSVAKKYFENIMSPFQEGVQNPLYDLIDGCQGKDKNAIDIGCGIGNAVPHLAGRFGHVTAVDISEKMIEVAREKQKFENVEFFVRNATELREFHGKFDLAIAVNSIISPSVKDLGKMFEEANRVLRDGGKFIAILPAMEAILYQAMLVYNAALEETGNERIARLRTKREVGKFDFLFGVDRGGFEQKYFYRFEIRHMLKKAKFSKIRIRRVLYPWEISKDAGFSPFAGKPRIWDWLVTAEK